MREDYESRKEAGDKEGDKRGKRMKKQKGKGDENEGD